jgi:hypothetical protein
MMSSLNGTNKGLYRDMFPYLLNQIDYHDDAIETLGATISLQEARIELN